MKSLLGLIELGVLTWGIIAFWGTPWSIAALVWIILDICVACYFVGKRHSKPADTASSIFADYFKDNK